MPARTVVHVRLGEVALGLLDDLADEHHITRSEVIRAALTVAMRDGHGMRQRITLMKGLD